MSTDEPAAQIRTVSDALSDVGRHRKHNEDAVLVRPEFGLFVVADGMGGHNAGDVASKLATTSISNFYEATTDAGFEGKAPEGYAQFEAPALRVLAAIRKANRDIFTISSTVAAHHGMGSTVVAAVVLSDGMIHLAHVGDSRAYRVSDGQIEQLTHDHSFINDVLRMKPDIDPGQLAKLPKNVITRALGMRADVDVDVRSEPTVPGDIYLLCSDGLSGFVQPPLMLEVLMSCAPTEACQRLIDEANRAGGRDNISAVVVQIVHDEVAADVDEDTLDQAPESRTFCAHCGTRRLEDFAFCVECGARILRDEV